MTSPTTPEDIMAAVPGEVFDRLTHGDDALAQELIEVVVRMYELGYDKGIRRGAEMLRDAVIARAKQ